MALIEDANGFVSEDGQPFHGATVAGLIAMGFDDDKLAAFEEWMRGQGVGIVDGSVYYFGHDIDRFERMRK
jgi:hypothetical protein